MYSNMELFKKQDINQSQPPNVQIPNTSPRNDTDNIDIFLRLLKVISTPSRYLTARLKQNWVVW